MTTVQSLTPYYSIYKIHTKCPQILWVSSDWFYRPVFNSSFTLFILVSLSPPVLVFNPCSSLSPPPPFSPPPLNSVLSGWAAFMSGVIKRREDEGQRGKERWRTGWWRDERERRGNSVMPKTVFYGLNVSPRFTVARFYFTFWSWFKV